MNSSPTTLSHGETSRASSGTTLEIVVAYGPTAPAVAPRLAGAEGVLRIVAGGELEADAEGFVDPTELRAMIKRAVNDRRELLAIECGPEADVGALIADLTGQSDDAPPFDGVDLKARVACMDAHGILDAFVEGRGASGKWPAAAIAEQVEFASVVALSADAATPGDAALADAIVRALNPAADVMRVESGEGALDLRSSTAVPAAATGDLVTTISFQARRPLHPQRFWSFLKTGLSGVFRGKGFFWVATHMDIVGGLNIAGREKQAAPVGAWWAAMPESQSDRAEWPEPISQEWVEPFGDRRQELTFLGLNLDEATLRAALDSCLLTPAEMAAGEQSWREFEDPFAAWSQAGHAHEHHHCGCDHEHHHGPHAADEECGHGSCCHHHHGH